MILDPAGERQRLENEAVWARPQKRPSVIEILLFVFAGLALVITLAGLLGLTHDGPWHEPLPAFMLFVGFAVWKRHQRIYGNWLSERLGRRR